MVVGPESLVPTPLLTTVPIAFLATVDPIAFLATVGPIALSATVGPPIALSATAVAPDAVDISIL